jgi:hypothetical protein
MKSDSDKTGPKGSVFFRFLTWPSLLLCAAWFLVSGFWMLKLAQGAADQWIGKPWAIPFVPYLNSETLVTPLAPFHALLTRADWLPLASMCVCGLGTWLLWKLTFVLAHRGYPRDSSQPEN